ncbi:MAG: AzlC family ABC transporter permease [Ruminococcaceae bacterium]|nr:AzlC family ABC transporter permease [Oscillospiraceae bacterium]
MDSAETQTYKTRSTRRQDYVRGLRHGIPIALGYLSVSFSFGIAAVSQGLDWWTAVLISMTNLTSAGQVAGLGIIVAGGTFVEMALAQLVINLRYALMSLSLSQKLAEKYSTFHRAITAFAMTDEIFAVASGQPGEVRPAYMYGLATLPFIGWSMGTLLGGLAGTLLPELLCAVLGLAIYGMFIAIIIPPARASVGVCAVVVLAAAMSCALRYIPLFSGISSGFSIIICAVLASAAGALIFPRREQSEEAEK